MLDWIRENTGAFVIAVVLHLVFLSALFFNWQFDKPDKIVLEQGDIIQVSAVDASSYDAEVRKIEQQKKADTKRRAEAKRQAEARALEEKRKKKQLEKRKKQEQQRKAEELKRKKAAKEKKEKAALKKLEQEKKQAEEKKKAEEKRKKEQLKKKQKEKAEQQKRRQEAKKKQQQAEQKRKAEAEQERQAELKLKEQRDRAERLRRSKGIINRHVVLISKKIERNWRQPLDAPHGLQCKVEIKLLSNGKVISVKIVESSGHLSFDRSVETAVKRASPLPVPEDNVIFKEFEVMILRFEPGSY